ncbi:glycerophosphodiester phosphodiesterase [Luteipulveratus mongoliensis]|uniref:Glycerophosphodiester phosphodiesterase n=1 Tax=Luteipulveratus mongoliensis TaxID=571913 RepID=A0A0K1JKF3_9MICO|nr:glycerophosphodiester phosphodiesterase [Luteipulveratus mongoliensis]AKU17060.1 glycerophosphodiester phosphodiesterase [Luteipulveratus mongoliensis]
MARTAYLEHDGVVAMAHRGFSRDGLENSMVAFAAAVELGYAYVETDVHATADRVLLAFHDDTLDRVTDGHGAIHTLPYHRVQQARIDGREPIPTLDELLDAWPDLKVNIDIKAEPAVIPLVEAIERHRAHDRVCITSFSDRRRRTAIKRLSRPVATSAGQSQTAAFVLAQASRLPGASSAALRGVDCLQVPERHAGIPVVTARSVRAAHAAGTQVHVWTVDEPSDMTRLLDLGVDGLITDRSDVLKDVLQQRGSWHQS